MLESFDIAPNKYVISKRFPEQFVNINNAFYTLYSIPWHYVK